jgi:hypothetical protein
MDKQILLRKLGGTEFLANENLKSCNFINTRVLQIETKIDVFSRYDLLIEAISTWKQAHVLLRCNIATNDEGHKCFAYAPDEVLKSHENLNFLCFQSSQTHVDMWKLFLEREIATPIHSSSLQWRLNLIQVDCDSSKTFSYYLVFTANHAIMDGLCLIRVLSQLFSFLERLHRGLDIQFEEYSILPCIDQFPEVIQYKLENMHQIKRSSVLKNKVPETMVHEAYTPYTRFESNSDAVFLTHEKKMFLTFKYLVEQNKNHFTRVEALVFDENILSKLLKLCKDNGTKLTGCLNLVAVLATQQTFKHFDDQVLDSIHYEVTVSLRSRLTVPVDLLKLGDCSILFAEDFKGYVDHINDDEFWSKTFWDYAKSESLKLHNWLKRDYLNVCSNDEEFYTYAFENDQKFKVFNSFFCLSNRGDVTRLAKTDFELFKFVSSYTGMAFGESNPDVMFMHLIESLNGKLFWSLCHNKNILKGEVYDFYANIITNSINKLVAD